MFRFSAKAKVFCIGNNKTGTTSLGEALKRLGYRLGRQSKGEMLVEDWARRDFRRIVRYCRSADAFQDIPFSLDHTYQVLDYAFPGSRFILTVRDSANEWYDSLTRFHTKIVGKNRLPTADDMRAFLYREPGWFWRAHELVFDITEKTLYDRQQYIAYYERHNDQVYNYFCHRPDSLLILNLADTDALAKLCAFLGKPFPGWEMPHLNRS